MTEQVPPAGPLQEPLPAYVHELRPEDGRIVLVSAIGGQVWRLATAERQEVILPLDELHSVSADPRPNPNSFQIGETSKPGGSWLSFGGGTLTHPDGTATESPVHGPYSAPSYRFQVSALTPSGIIMDGEPDGRTKAFFLPGQAFAVRREVAAGAGYDGLPGLSITNTFTNRGDSETLMPEAVEHTYLTSGHGAAILNANGKLTQIEAIPRTTGDNGNYVDAVFDTSLTGTPGRCVFLPEGPDGRVVVIDAAMSVDDSHPTPINAFCAYRYRPNDPWTAIEPTMTGINLEVGQRVSMTTSLQAFASLGDYFVAQIT